MNLEISIEKVEAQIRWLPPVNLTSDSFSLLRNDKEPLSTSDQQSFPPTNRKFTKPDFCPSNKLEGLKAYSFVPLGPRTAYSGLAWICRKGCFPLLKGGDGLFTFSSSLLVKLF